MHRLTMSEILMLLKNKDAEGLGKRSQQQKDDWILWVEGLIFYGGNCSLFIPPPSQVS